MDLDLVKFATRRYFLRECWTGIGAVALASLLNDNLFAAERDPMAPRQPQFPARAKRVIFLNMSGGPSQLELFDFKPKLIELHGKPIPKSVVGSPAPGDLLGAVNGRTFTGDTPETQNLERSTLLVDHTFVKGQRDNGHPAATYTVVGNVSCGP